MRKLMAMILWAAVMLSQVPTASAFVLEGDYSGPLVFKFVDFSEGTIHGSSSPGYGEADGVEDGWGVFKISAIHADNFTSDLLWFDGKDGEQLTGIFHGLDDDFFVVSGGSQNIQSVDGVIEVYLDSVTPFDASGGPAARTGAGSYPTVTDGSLFLELAMVPGIKFGDLDPTNDYISYDNNLDFTTPTNFTGDGAFYLDVTGGSHAGMFDSNSVCLVDDSGVSHCSDFSGVFDVQTSGSGPWLTKSDDPIHGSAIPEPTTLLLLGSGVIGMVGGKLKRKRS